jgi:hypothetical protein
MVDFSGEKLTKEEAKGLMKELCDPADDDGFMPFKRKSFYDVTVTLGVNLNDVTTWG